MKTKTFERFDLTRSIWLHYTHPSKARAFKSTECGIWLHDVGLMKLDMQVNIILIYLGFVGGGGAGGPKPMWVQQFSFITVYRPMLEILDVAFVTYW